ncbi:hypothetical protein ABS71_06780 [bacterium SCN 62-11]|nr:hypothetical protein [Candidatus Eremiobacteraeota bacterium]ODT73685.1 MAG: hypothetical protein ABS71_06780 [bacterium SCN 62-11]
MIPILAAGLVLTLGWTWLFRHRSGEAGPAQAHLLELLLYGECPGVLARVLLDLTRSCARLARSWLAPSLLSLGLLALVVFCLQPFVCWRPFQVGETILLSLRDGKQLQHDPGLSLDSAPVWDSRSSARYWRLRAQSPGLHRVWAEPAGPRAAVRVGGSFPYLQRRQGPFQVFYPVRSLWLGDRLVSWPAALLGSCLLWLAASGMLQVVDQFQRR